MKKALITGITGQDGSYLAELLLSKGYEVHGLIRRASTFNTRRIDHIYHDPHPNGQDVHLYLHYGDVSAGDTLLDVIYNVRPDEIYHLAAQSHVRVSFDMPEYTGDVTGLGTIRILEAVRKSGAGGALLPGLVQRDVWRRQAPAKRSHGLRAAQPVCGCQGVRLLGDAQLPRRLQYVRLQRHPL